MLKVLTRSTVLSMNTSGSAYLVRVAPIMEGQAGAVHGLAPNREALPGAPWLSCGEPGWVLESQARVVGWRKRCSTHKPLPYNSFGQILYSRSTEKSRQKDIRIIVHRICHDFLTITSQRVWEYENILNWFDMLNYNLLAQTLSNTDLSLQALG